MSESSPSRRRIGSEGVGDTRLIERWLPIAELGEESTRERRSMTALPPTYYLHVWWARRPLVASRAAVLASLLPADADREKFLHVLGIHGDPIAAKERIAVATRNGERLGAAAYGYPRAFGYNPRHAGSGVARRERSRRSHRARSYGGRGEHPVRDGQGGPVCSRQRPQSRRRSH